MSIQHETIFEECRPILETVEFHVTEIRRERRFITAYQIWFELQREINPICDELIDACKGNFVGKDAGSNIGPAQKIAQSLGNSAEIETQYFDTKYVSFDGIKPAGPDCGLFRLRS